MRNAECGMRNLKASVVSRLDLPLQLRIPNSAFRILSLAQGQEIRKQPIRTRDTSGELPEEAQPRIDIRALAERGLEQPALERRLPGIVHLDERRVRGIPVVREIQSALLPPPPPVVGPDFV